MIQQTFICDGCKATSPAENDQLPLGWSTIHVQNLGVLGRYTSDAFDMCRDCQQRLVRHIAVGLWIPGMDPLIEQKLRL